MLFRRIKTPGLAQHSYFLDCGNGEAVIVDPRRDVLDYLRLSRRNGLSIAYVLQTHRQEDFEYGSSALASAGARIVTGVHELSGRSDIRLRHGEELKSGGTRFVLLETPGHTPESVSYAVYREDAGARCWAVFSGDALFVGETGRTDLADRGKAGENAGILFDSIHREIAPLGNQALLFPAHGSGSACGGHISERDDSTLGIEKDTNPVFTRSRDEFIAHKLSEKLPRPPYFSHMEQVNLLGGRPLQWPRSIPVLRPSQFQKAMANALVIDTRSPDAFASAHVPGSCNVWLKGLPSFGGWIADEHSRVGLVLDSEREVEDAVLSLARIGIDAVEGILAGGIAAWREQGLPIAALGTIGAVQAATWIRQDRVQVLDVRDEQEWNEGHIAGAMHNYVGDLEGHLPAIPKDAPILVHCSVGNRSGLAASLLARHGFTNVFNLLGGMKAWRSLHLPLE